MGVILDGDKVRLKIPANLEDYERQADELADDDVLRTTSILHCLTLNINSSLHVKLEIIIFRISVMGSFTFF